MFKSRVEKIKQLQLRKIKLQYWLFFGITVLFVGVYGATFLGERQSVQAAGTAIYWKGGTGNWNDASYWVPAQIPTADDTVTINNGTVTVPVATTASFSTLTIATSSASTFLLTGDIGTGGDITVGNLGVLTQNNVALQTITGGLWVQTGGTLKHSDNSTTQVYIVNFSAASSTISGSINVDGLGYDAGVANTAGRGTGAGQPPANGINQGGGGGSHGGDGGTGGNQATYFGAGGTGYCDITNVATMGSGGAGGGGVDSTGNGGGLIVLNITGTLTVNGTITADGAAGASYRGGGAGGGVKIMAGTVAGTPTSFTVTGGNSGNYGGAGGGGCVQIVYTNSSSILSGSSITMNGGTNGLSQNGGAGEVFIKQSVAQYGDLYLINTASATTTTQGINSLTLNSLTLTYANYRVTSTASLVFSGTASPFASSGTGGTVTVQGTINLNYSYIDGVTLSLSSGSTFTNSPTLNITNDGGLVIGLGASLANNVSTLTSSGTLDIYQNATNNRLGVSSDLNIQSGTATLYNYTTSNALTLDELYMTGGTLTHGDNSTAQTHVINISAASSTIASGASVNVDSKGYDPSGTVNTTGYGPGPGTAINSSGGGGGAHGGNGGNGGSGSGGTAYCDIANVATMGSSGAGGGGVVTTGNGGGLIIFNDTGTLTISGTITADGAAGASYRGGGAGGGVKITAGTIAGTPTSFTVTGGNTGGSGGGGGGGCVQIGYSDTDSISSSGGYFSYAGGTGGTQDGSVGLFAATQLSPNAPTTLYSSNTDATSGSADPTNLTTLTPVFSAICNTSSGSCTHAGVQVSTDSGFSSTVWDSGQLDITDKSNGQRNVGTEIVYNSNALGEVLLYNTTYYWRIRFYNGYTGSWSTETATFYIPRSIELYNFNSGGAVQVGQSVNIMWGSTGGSDSESEKVDIYYSTNGTDWTAVTSSVASASSSVAIKTYAWTIPNDPSATVKIKITSNNDANYSVTSENNFTIQAGASANGVKAGRTFTNSLLYTSSASASFSSGNVQYVAPSWYNASWSYRKTITLTSNAAKIPATQTSFPVLVDLTDADLAARALSDGNDILFTLTDGTKLSHEIESYTTATGRLTAWVNVPSLAAGTVLYMYYGNAGASNQQSVINVWDSDYKTVWHLAETSGTQYDSTINDNDSTSITLSTQGSATAKIGGADDFDGVDDKVVTTNNDSLKIVGKALTVSAWIAWDAFDDYTGIIMKTSGTGWADGYGLYGLADKSINFFVSNYDYNAYKTYSVSADGSYHYVVGTYDGSNLRIYVDGVEGTSYVYSSNISASTNVVELGRGYNDSYNLNGRLDEVRISSYARSANWITTEYANQSSTSTFYTVGSQTALDLSDQTVKFNVGHTFSSVNSFSATTAGTGSVRFLISGDGGSNPTWKYCSGGALVGSDGTYAQASAAGDITDGCLTGFSGTAFNVQAILHNTAGQTATLSDVSFNILTNTAPANSITAVSQKTDGSGSADISVSVDDGEDSDLAKLKVQYTSNPDCVTGLSAATIDTTLANISATFGTPSTTNSSAYQIGTSDGWIQTSSGANTVSFDWLTKTDLPAGNGSYCISVTPNDGATDGTAATSTITIDNVNPVSAGNLALSSITNSSLILTLGTAGSDTNLNQYKIYYKATGGPEVSQSDTLASTIATGAYSEGGHPSIGSLSANIEYDTNIWTYDSYGNSISATHQAFYTAANVPASVATSSATASTITWTWSTNSNPAGTQFSASDATGDSGWVANATSWTNSGASVNTQYTVSVKAKNASGTETDAVTASAYTLANVPDAPTVTTSTPTSLNVVANANSNPAGTQFAIQEVASGKYVQANGSLGVSAVWQTTAQWGTAAVTGAELTANSSHQFQVKAKNGDGVETAFGAASAAVYTLAVAPGVPTITVLSESSLNLKIDKVTNPDSADVTYAICKTTDDTTCVVNGYVLANGTIGNAAEVWQSYTDWGGAAGKNITGLVSHTAYKFIVKARNHDNIETAFSGVSVETSTLNQAPTLIDIYPSQTSASIVTVTTTITDLDSDATTLDLEYSLDGSTWTSSTLSNVTVNHGAVATTTGNISGIDTNDGLVELTIEWNIAQDALNTDDLSVYYRLIPRDSLETGLTASSTAFAVDTKDPTAPGDLVVYSVSTSSVRFTFPTTTSTDTNFLEYKIFYSLSSPVTTADSAFTSSTDPQLGSSIFSDGAISASSTGYADDTLYYFRLFAFDRWGRNVSSAEVSTTTILDNTAPTLSGITATNFQNGTGQVKIMVTVDDVEDGPVKIKTEYRAGDCDTYDNLAYTQLVNSVLVNSVSSTYFSGDIVLNNAAGDGSRISNIKTSSGANETWYYWDSATDLPAGSGTYCLFLTPDDGLLNGAGSRVSTTVILDNFAPTAPGYLTVNTTSTNSVTFNFGAATVDDNFSQYKIHYRQGSSGVVNSDTALTSATDPNLGLINYGGAGTTILTGLNTSTQYVADIWAYDTFGNYTSSSQVISVYTLAAVPAAPSVAVSTTNILHLTINKNNNPDNVTYYICRTVVGNTCDGGNSYVQADGSLGGSAVWQSYVAWGGVDGLDVTGLSENAGFQFIVQARNAENTPTDFSGASPTVYTYSGALSSLVATNSSNTTTLQVDLSFTSTTQSGLKIERDTSCDGTFETTIYDDNNALPNSPSTTLNYSANTCYRFRSYSYNLGGALNIASLTPSNNITTPPGQVLDLTADSIEENEIDWTWTAVAGATSYNVYLYNGDGILQEVVSADSNSYIQGSLKNNTTYIIEVRAQNANGEGISSGQSEAVTDASVPTGLHATDRTVSSVIWAWDANTEAENVTEFYARDAIAISGWSVDTTWTRIGLDANAVSVGKVKARNSTSQDTAYSGTVTSYSAQNAPTGVSFSGVATDSITATALGDFPNNGVGSAALYFSNDIGGNSGAVVAGTSWANGSLSPNVQYAYTVYAANSNASTTATAFASKYTLANTPGKIITTVGGSSTILNLALAANSNPDATNFLLYCTTTGQYIDTAAKTLTGDINDFDTLTNWSGSVALTGLTPNTPYQFQAIAKNGENIITASSTDSDVIHTLASLPANVISTPLSPTQITVSWEANGNPGDTEYYVVDTDVDHLDRNSNWITDTSYTFNDLTPGAEYIFQVKAKNHDGVPTAFVLSAVSAANPLTPGTITVTRGDSATSLNLVLDANGNSNATTYARIYSTTTGQFVDTTAKTLTGDSSDFSTFTNWGSPVIVTGLTPNTSYQFDAIAKNSLDVLSSTSTDSVAIYTHAAVPSLTATVDDSISITLTWTTNNNPSGTEYYVEDAITTSRNSDWITATTHTFTGLTVGTAYSFRVKARNGDSVSTSYTSSVSATTESSGGSAAPAAAPPTIPPPTVVEQIKVGEQPFAAISTEATPNAVESIQTQLLSADPITTPSISATFGVNSGISMNIGSGNDSIILTSLTSNSATFALYSKLQIVTMKTNEEVAKDMDNDGKPDLYMKLTKVDEKKKEATITVTDLNDLPLTINNNFSYTTSPEVTLTVKDIPGVTQIAVSEDKNFAYSSFEPYTKTRLFTLSPKEGLKTIYLRFRNAQGGTADVQASITYTKDASAYKKLEESLKKTTEKALTTTVTKIFTNYLQIGSRGTEVSNLQIFLRDLNYFKYPQITKFFGKITANALKLFQKDNQLSASGALDANTRKTINNIIQPTVEPIQTEPLGKSTSQTDPILHNLCAGSPVKEVRNLQTILINLGYLKIDKTTGNYAAKTKAAVKQFQIDHKLSPAHGCVGPATRGVLNKL